MSQVAAPDSDIVREALRVVDASTQVPLRLLGGVAIVASLPGEPLLPRLNNDIDFITAVDGDVAAAVKSTTGNVVYSASP